MASTLDIAKAERLLQALGDPSRRAIINALSSGPCSVSALAKPLGITLTGVSQHLTVLQACDLVRTHKSGRVRICTLDPKGLTVLEQWIAHHRAMWTERLDQLGAFLDEDGEGK